MRRKNDTPTRSEVSGKIAENKKEMSARVENLDVIASDSETVKGTIDALEAACDDNSDVSAPVVRRDD